MRFQGGRKFAHPPRLAPLNAVHADRVAHQDQPYFARRRQVSQRGQVGALIGSVQIGKALCRNAEWVADGEADAFFAQVQSQNAGGRGRQCNFIIDGAMLQSKQGRLSFVALVTQPTETAAKAVREARHLALPMVAMGVVIAVLYFGRVFFITSITAVIIAFILEPFVTLLMRVRLPRSVASFVVCSVALLLLYVIGMGAYTQLSAMYGDLPTYGQRIADIVDDVRQRVQGMEDRTLQMLVPARRRQEEKLKAQQQAEQTRKTRNRRQEPPPQPAVPPGTIPEVRIHEENPSIGEYIYTRLSSFYQILLMVSFIPFLVYFMLSWGEHMNRAFLQFFHGEDRLVAARSLQGIAAMARAFVVGNFLLGLFMAVLSSAFFWAMHLPYPLLVGPLSGFMSLLPYVGLPLAMAPPLFSALSLNAVPTYVLVIASVAMLHLVAMNLLYPKLVGSRVHLNPLVVTFSLMLWGFLWDAPGLLLAIPLTAGLKAVCDNVRGLRPIGKFLGD
jgi:predicted PurR-regulated permease PerM